MKLKFWRFVMYFAWTCDGYANEFCEWAQHHYYNEAHGIGTID